MSDSTLHIGTLASNNVNNIVNDTSKYDKYKEKVKELEKELQTRKDTFEKMTEPLVYVCDCYQKFNVVTGMPKSTFGDSFGYAMQKEISDYMQDFYAGKVSREDLDSYFEKCCTSMRTYRTGQHQTSGTNEADNTQIVSEMYEVFAKENARAAGSGAVKNIKKKNIKSAREKLNDAKAEIKSDKNNNDVYVKKTAAKTDDKKKSTDTKQHDGNIKKNRNTDKNKTVSTMSNDNSLKFDAEKGMIWPVGSGEKDIILKFSNSNTVYFKTLAQYKVNPAVVIAAKADEKVKAAAAGIVKSIKTSDETGTTVTVDIGNGYEAIYGQLKNLNVKNGQKIAKGDIVGHIAKPTKYYTEEGTNLYFEVKENGKSVDPLLLLK